MARNAIVSLILLFIAAAPAAAQTQTDFGIKGGFNASKLNVDPEEPDVDFKNLIGPTGGVFATIGRGALAGQIEALYSRRGTKAESEGEEFQIKLTSIDVPLLLRFNGAPGRNTFFITAGTTLGFIFDAKQEAEGFEEDITDDVEKFDAGVTVGAGVQTGNLVLEGRYTHGLTNLSTDEDEGKFRLRVWTFLVGFAF
jgi:hypothetical protein